MSAYKLIPAAKIPEIVGDLKEVTIDTETTGFDWWAHKLCYVQIGTGDGKAFLVDVRKYSPELQALLSNPKVGKVFHKASFDVLFLEQNGYKVEHISFDTKLAAYILDNTQENGLKDLAQKYLRREVLTFDEIIPKAQRAKKGEPRPPKPTILDVEPAVLLEYACADADNTYELKELFRPEIQRQGFMALMEMELCVQNILIKMQRNGCKMNLAKADKLRIEVQNLMFNASKQAHTCLKSDFNLDSPKQLVNILYGQLALPICGLSKTTGLPSTDEKSLKCLVNDHPIVQHILEYKKYAKLLGTYLEPLPQLVDEQDCLHGRFNQEVTDTGRLSSSGPNLQNIPVKTKLGIEYRNCFISRFKDGKLLVADYNQIEVRILAHLSKDPVLIRALKDGMDTHKLTASFIYGIRPEKVTKPQRNIAKTINFGIIYGMGSNKLAADTGLSEKVAAEYIKKYFMQYKGVKEYKENQEELADKRGYVETLLGRKLFIAKGKYAGTRAINYSVQGSAAEVIKKAMVQCDCYIEKEDLKTLPILQVHDELVWDVPANEHGLIQMKIPQLMHNVIPIAVDLPVDARLVNAWGEAKN